jgi:hypothetical protein
MECMIEMGNAYIILIGKPEGKGPFRSPRHRWEDNMKLYLGEIGWKVWTECIRHRIGTIGWLL